MTARLVATGRVFAPFKTMHMQYATSDPLWEPQPSGEEHVDDDLWRKQQIEQRLAEDY